MTDREATAKPWYKSPLIWVAIAISAAIVGGAIAAEFNTTKITHYRADDNSTSADKYTHQRRIHCQLSNQHYKPGDVVVEISFADRAIAGEKINIFNSLTLMKKCQNTNRKMRNLQPGTSLVLLLEKAEKTIKEQNQEHPQPGVLTILANAFEPGPNQPQADLDRVEALVNDILAQKVKIALMMPDSPLSQNLSEHLGSKVTFCPLEEGTKDDAVRNSIAPCLDPVFQEARQLKS